MRLTCFASCATRPRRFRIYGVVAVAVAVAVVVVVVVASFSLAVIVAAVAAARRRLTDVAIFSRPPKFTKT